MKRTVWHAVLTVVAGLCVTGSAYAAERSASPAAYEEGSYVSSEVATLRAEVDSLRQQLDSTMTTGYDDGKKPAPKADGGSCGCNSCCNSCCNDCCNDCCCEQGHLFFDYESTWFRYHRATDFDNDNVFGYEHSPRFTVGYVGANGFGVRARYWQYDHSGEDDGGLDDISVDTYNIDFEVFEEVSLGCNTGLEWSAGMRYNDFEEDSDELGEQVFSAYGILVGARIYHSLPIGGAMFAGVKAAWLMSNWRNDDSGQNFDTTRVVTEVTTGYEYRTCLSGGAVLTLRAAFEMQNWENYVVREEDVDDDDPIDVGFGGFVFGGSLTY